MSENDNKKGWYFIIFILVLVLGMWFSYPFWSYFYKDYFYNTEFSEMGVFGDSYGALNTLFSALAFTGIIASIYFQREELKVTRGELEATREEMKSQGEQFSLQTKAMQKQVFETTFFNMVSLHNTITSKFRGVSDFSTLNATLLRYAEQSRLKKSCDIHANLTIIYGQFMRSEYDKVGHYFRYVYQILKFIDISELHADEKVVYSNIIRAQMSNHELNLIFVNCLCYGRSDKFKTLVEKMSFFEHIYFQDIENLLMRINNNPFISDREIKYNLNDLKALYSPSAYEQ